MDEISGKRLDNRGFRELVPYLPLADIFLVEVDSNLRGKFKKLVEITDESLRSYRCNLCELRIVGPKSLVGHLEGKKHKINVATIGHFYHPVYTYKRDDLKVALGKADKKEVREAEERAKTNLKSHSKDVFIKCYYLGRDASRKIRELDERLIASHAPPDKLTPKNPKIPFSAQNLIEIEEEKNAVTKQKEEAKPKSEDKKTKENEVTGEQQESLKETDLEPTDVENGDEDGENEVDPDADRENVLEDNEEQEEENEAAETVPEDIEYTEEPTDSTETIKETEENEETKENEEEENTIQEVDENLEEQNEELDENNEENDDEPSKSDTESVIEEQNCCETKVADETEVQEDEQDLNASTGGVKRSLEVPTSSDDPPVKLQKISKPKFLDVQTALSLIRKDHKKTEKSSSRRDRKSLEKKNVSTQLQGIVGVEYIIKILKSREDPKPVYECTLCELRHSAIGMQKHLMGYIHRLKYCEINYPKCIKHYKKEIGEQSKPQMNRIMQQVLKKLAISIEEYHGRDVPMECMKDAYDRNPAKVKSKTFSLRHACEGYGPSMTNVISKEDIKCFIALKDTYKAPNLDNVEIQFQTKIPGVLYLGMKKKKPDIESPEKDNKRARSRTRSPRRRRERERSSSRQRRRTRSRSDRRRSRSISHSRRRRRDENSKLRRKSLSPLQKGDIWQAYRHLFDRSKSDLDNAYKIYRKDPETHPQYDEEWNKFWRMRKAQLIANGVDHRTYDYQPDWVRFFKGRVEEIYAVAVENLKMQARQRLCLPMTNDHLIDVKYHILNIPIDVNPSQSQMSSNFYSGDNTNMMIQSNDSTHRGKPTILPVLRLMTALEDHLGSLGPKIIDLLTKSLTAEKSNPSQVDAIILTPKNCTLLETAMEKLKGVMMAGLLEGSKIRAFNKVINDTEQLLGFVEDQRVQSADNGSSLNNMGSLGNVNNPSYNNYSQTGPNYPSNNNGNLWQNLQNIRQNISSNSNNTDSIRFNDSNFNNPNNVNNRPQPQSDNFINYPNTISYPNRNFNSGGNRGGAGGAGPMGEQGGALYTNWLKRNPSNTFNNMGMGGSRGPNNPGEQGGPSGPGIGNFNSAMENHARNQNQNWIKGQMQAIGGGNFNTTGANVRPRNMGGVNSNWRNN